MFHVGQLVVCVDAERRRYCVPGHAYGGGLDGLTKGNIYTIRWCGMFNHTDGSNTMSVCLYEIVRPPYGITPEDCPYAAARFRPVVETRLDVFREMLAPVSGVKQKECV